MKLIRLSFAKQLLLLCTLSLAPLTLSPIPALAASNIVTLLRTPNGGLQPQAVVNNGVLHLIYFKGDPAHGDIFYVHKPLGTDAPFSTPIRVNSGPGSAIAIGTIRGAQLAVGQGGRVHVTWNGSNLAPKGPGGNPFLYTRLNAAGTAFEPERNVITWAGGIDGGGSVASDADGHVYVTWHALGAGKDEASGSVYLSRSDDNGVTFGREKQIAPALAGECGCCAMRAFVDHTGAVYILYRTAGQSINRDTTLLVSHDKGRNFQSSTLHRWKLNACPMTSFSMDENASGVLGAWETEGQVYYGQIGQTVKTRPIAAPGSEGRKYPVVVSGPNGNTLFAWVNGGGWERGGSVSWQVYDKEGTMTLEKGQSPGVPIWSLISAVARPDGTFVIVY